jgi:hypothetical protein
MSLEQALNTAFHANAFNGFDAAEFDVEAYLERQAPGDFFGFDGFDLIELTEHYSPAALTEHYSPAANGVEGLWGDEPWDGFNSDAEADADALASIGWGTDEDYGYYGEE